ncbi:hypothetical protein [Alicyclobacillus sp.]|uniref:hypothetical protein n=1 Tax=Alicyclobacillus sp. TaxID=61169 RepID=UPI0025C46C4D|nr:hypothetical protein [Alicyclobacillus sp.]MCL6515330.1 hypothetical protein [Alicyclobacillus sp.]
MRIAAARLREAQEVLLRHGFSKQHERIFSMDVVERDRGVQCMVGLDQSEDPLRFEVQVRCLERPVTPGKKGTDIARVRVIDLNAAPASIRAAAEAALAELAALEAR